MSARPIPHIGATLSQRTRLTSNVEVMLSRTYRAEQRELEAERARFERTTAALQVDALLDRLRQHDTSGCAECEDEAPMSPWLFWPVVVSCSLVLTVAAYELTKLLPLIWRLS